MRLPETETPPSLHLWFEKHQAMLRARVLAYLARGLRGALDLDVVDLPPGRSYEL